MKCLVIALALGVSGCASTTKEIQTAHVSSLSYQGYDCAQLGAELRHLRSRVEQLAGQVDATAERQKQTAIGLAAHPIGWPFLLVVPFQGNKAQEAEYSRLKGEYKAIQVAAEGKKCSEFEDLASN